MSLISTIKSMFGGSSAAVAVERETDRTYIVDAEKLAESRDGSGRIGPVERFQAIQQLSRFAEREKVEIIAVVGGRPLREVAHGESYNGVRVFYVEGNATMADTIAGIAGGSLRGRKPVVVTNDRQLEVKLAGQGIATLRVTTLRRAFEGGSESGGQDGGRGPNRRRRGGRGGNRGERGERGGMRPGETQDRAEDASQPDSSDEGGDDIPDAEDDEPAQERERTLEPRRNPAAKDTIDNLIDRVD